MDALPEGHSPLFVIGIVGHPATSAADLQRLLGSLSGHTLSGHWRRLAAGAHAELSIYVDYEHSVAYIVLFAQEGLLTSASSLAVAESDDAVHGWFNDRSSERALTVLAHLCHVLIFVCHGRCADLHLLRTLRAASTLRHNLHSAVAAALKPSQRQGGASPLPALPTLGFVFAPCTPRLSVPRAAQLQHALELQLRRLLTSSKQLARAVGSGGASTFGLLPKPCVHVEPFTPPPIPTPVADGESSDAATFNRLTGVLAASRPLVTSSASCASDDEGGMRGWLSTLRIDAATPSSTDAKAERSAATALRRFVAGLVDDGLCHLAPCGLLAAGGTQGQPTSSLASASAWSAACRHLMERVFLPEPSEDGGGRSHPEREGGSHPERSHLPSSAALPRLTLTKIMDAEINFSLARGQAALPLALEAYSRALPPQYTRQVHESRVTTAQAHVVGCVLGPAREATIVRLRRECLDVWQAGRQLCDAVSLTGRPCTFRVHMLPREAAEPPEGLAAASGLLRVGDKLIAVNGASVRGHARATTTLKSAVGALRLRIIRSLNSSDDEDEVEVVLNKPRLTSKLGIVLSSASADSGIPTITGLGTNTGANANSDARSARPHSSLFTAWHACYCGKTQRQRLDPFSLQDAIDFFDSECCAVLQHLPVEMRCSPIKPAKGHKVDSSQHAASATSGDVGLTDVLAPAPMEDVPQDVSAAPMLHTPKATAPSGNSTPMARTAPFHGEESSTLLARLSVLCESAAFDPLVGIVADGFLPGHNQLTKTAVLAPTPPAAPAAPPKSVKSAWAAPAVAALPHVKPAIVDVYLGCEYECSQGHRFIAAGSGNGTVGVPGTGARKEAMPLADLISDATPLVRGCCADGCARYAQLQRIYVCTPDADVKLVLRPRVRFDVDVALKASASSPSTRTASTATPGTAGNGGKDGGVGDIGHGFSIGAGNGACLSASSAVVLPRGTLACLCLPYLYTAPNGCALLTKAVASDMADAARDAALLPRWLDLDANAGWEESSDAAWVLPKSRTSDKGSVRQDPRSEVK